MTVTELTKEDVDKIALRVARETIGTDLIRAVSTSTTYGTDGENAWHVKFTLTPGSIDGLPSGSTLNNLVRLRRELSALGDTRFPYTEYTTEEEERELAAHADD